MPPRLMFPDVEATEDTLTFVRRAARLDADLAVRLQASGGALALFAPVLTPRHLLDSTPTVLALRVVPVDAELECDLVVAASGIQPLSEETQLALPATARRESWAGVSPPRSGWTRAGQVASGRLRSLAREGRERVAQLVPTDAGADIVHTVRNEVWGRPDESLQGMPAAVAFAAETMGFLGEDETAPLMTHRGWRRLTLRRGHILVRGGR